MNKIENRDEQKIYEIFEEQGIEDYSVQEHEAVFTEDEVDALGLEQLGMSVKNLLLKQKKSETYFLVLLEGHRHMDLKHFKEVAGWKQVRFAREEEMVEMLGVTPGSATPLGLFHDSNNQVVVVIDRAIASAEDSIKLCFHPCRNTATLTMNKRDFYKYLRYLGNEIIEEK